MTKEGKLKLWYSGAILYVDEVPEWLKEFTYPVRKVKEDDPDYSISIMQMSPDMKEKHWGNRKLYH